jgi:hypothetical protein
VRVMDTLSNAIDFSDASDSHKASPGLITYLQTSCTCVL